MSTKLKAGTSTSGAVLDADTTGILELQSGSTPTTAVTINASQNVGIGTSSPATKLDVSGAASTNNTSRFVAKFTDTSAVATNNGGGIMFQGIYTGSTAIDCAGIQAAKENATDGNYSYAMTFANRSNGNNLTEKMRIDSSGNVLVGTTSSAETSGVGIKFLPAAVAGLPELVVVTNYATSSATPIYLYNTNATNNGARFYVKIDGGIGNFSGNNTNLSDERTKTNIELAGSYLDKICSIPVKLFNYKDEEQDEQRTLGVIAQDVEIIAPELVNNDGFGEIKENETPLKSIYTTDLMFGLMKAIQELNAKVDAQATTIAELQARTA
jgi:hypothetical protein